MSQFLDTKTDILQKFFGWTKRKIAHHFTEIKNDIYFYEGQVWWVALGKNVGYEMDGKHELFERPALVLKKYSDGMCFILPLTTQVKSPLPWYQILISIGGKCGAINITQGRTISTRRLLRKEGAITLPFFKQITEQFVKQFIKN